MSLILQNVTAFLPHAYVIPEGNVYCLTLVYCQRTTPSRHTVTRQRGWEWDVAGRTPTASSRDVVASTENVT